MKFIIIKKGICAELEILEKFTRSSTFFVIWYGLIKKGFEELFDRLGDLQVIDNEATFCLPYHSEYPAF